MRYSNCLSHLKYLPQKDKLYLVSSLTLLLTWVIFASLYFSRFLGIMMSSLVNYYMRFAKIGEFNMWVELKSRLSKHRTRCGAVILRKYGRRGFVALFGTWGVQIVFDLS